VIGLADMRDNVVDAFNEAHVGVTHDYDVALGGAK